MSNHIGHVFNNAGGRVVWCECCYRNFNGNTHPSSKLYKENVFPYKQTCHSCGNILVFGKTEAWVELYPKDRSPDCKLTMVTINGIAKLLNLPVIDGKPRITWAQIREHWNLPEDACICIG